MFLVCICTILITCCVYIYYSITPKLKHWEEGNLFHNHLPRGKMITKGTFCSVLLCPSCLLFLTGRSTGAVTRPRKKTRLKFQVQAEHIPSVPTLSQGARSAGSGLTGQILCCGMVISPCCLMLECNTVMNYKIENYRSKIRWQKMGQGHFILLLVLGLWVLLSSPAFLLHQHCSPCSL